MVCIYYCLSSLSFSSHLMHLDSIVPYFFFHWSEFDICFLSLTLSLPSTHLWVFVILCVICSFSCFLILPDIQVKTRWTKVQVLKRQHQKTYGKDQDRRSPVQTKWGLRHAVISHTAERNDCCFLPWYTANRENVQSCIGGHTPIWELPREELIPVPSVLSEFLSSFPFSVQLFYTNNCHLFCLCC